MTEELSNSAMWALIVGFALPIIIAFFEQPGWSNEVRAWVALAVSLVVGFITAYLSGRLGLSLQTVVTDVLLVVLTAIGTYKGFWQSSGIAPAIERATSKTP